jgi:hypothetical protein
VFFFEKKNQKTFAIWSRRCQCLRDQIAKVFCFFSSEKKTFLFLSYVMFSDRHWVGFPAPGGGKLSGQGG